MDFQPEQETHESIRKRKKRVAVKLVGDASEEYALLEKATAESGPNSFEKQLLKSVNQKISLLKNNPTAGIQILRSLIPKKYAALYDVNNLWKMNLAGYWRMVYTIKTDEVEILSIILDVIDHNEYNRLFGYRKK